MKAGDEVPAGKKTDDEYREILPLLKHRQHVWLIKKWGPGRVVLRRSLEEYGVPSDTELKRREVSG